MRLKACHRLCITSCVTIAVLLTIPLRAFATAEEEPSPLNTVQEAIQLSAINIGPESFQAAPVPISMAGQQPNSRPSDVKQSQVALISGYIASRNRNLISEEIDGIARAIVDYSTRYGVDCRLLTSLICVESSFRRDAISSAGAIGMGQLKPDTAKWLGVVDPFDPVDNIAGTARFLAWLVRKYNGNLESALSAYYQGPGFVDRNGVTDVCMPYLEKINQALIGLI